LRYCARTRAQSTISSGEPNSRTSRRICCGSNGSMKRGISAATSRQHAYRQRIIIAVSISRR
jgi:hypothetical protein